MINNNSKKSIYISLSIIGLMVIFVISSFTYAFFTANVTSNSELDIITNVSESYTPVFTTSSNADLSLTVYSADMLEGDASSENTTVAASNNTTLTASMIAGSDSVTYTCNFNFYYTNTGTTYTQTDSSVKEYTIQIDDVTNSSSPVTVLSERQVPTTNSVILSNQSITSSGSLATKTYKITMKIYNLNIPQDIYNKTYNSSVSITGISCAEN